MKKIIIILMIIFTQTPTFGYKIIQRQIPPIYNRNNSYWNNQWRYRNYNYPNFYTYNGTPLYQRYNPIVRIKRHFVGAPTGYTITPNYNINSNTQNQRSFFEDSFGDEYYYDNGSYYTQNKEINGGGSVTIIND